MLNSEFSYYLEMSLIGIYQEKFFKMFTKDLYMNIHMYSFIKFIHI